jgi:hypothetical protein
LVPIKQIFFVPIKQFTFEQLSHPNPKRIFWFFAHAKRTHNYPEIHDHKNDNFATKLPLNLSFTSFNSMLSGNAIENMNMWDQLFYMNDQTFTSFCSHGSLCSVFNKAKQLVSINTTHNPHTLRFSFFHFINSCDNPQNTPNLLYISPLISSILFSNPTPNAPFSF